MSIESARTVTLGTFENNNMVTPISTINNNEQMSSELLELRSRVEQIDKEKEAIKKEKQELLTHCESIKEEKNQLETQYQTLLNKLKVIADKYKSNMDELNKSRQEKDQLSQQNQELSEKLNRLQSEMSVVNEGNQRITSQLETLQSHIFEIQEQSANEINEKDNYIKKLQNDLDRSESEREELEVVAMELKSAKEVSLNRIKHFEMETELLRNEKETLKIEKNNESESLANLQAVLEEFEAAKQSEIKEAVEGMQRRLSTTSKELAEYKDRALLAENQLRQIKQEVGKTTQYEKEIKVKNLLIGKLRHEAIILNEHLTEALRRMREESSENNVDKRLITNLLIAFFNTPRGDSKRFEILQLMANMLQWSEEQKEKVGLIRKASINRPIEDRSSGWVSGLWTPTLERPRSRLSEDVPRPTIRISEDEEDRPKEVLI
nr:1672_t:CDS:2 [Entrophospora candida]